MDITWRDTQQAFPRHREGRRKSLRDTSNHATNFQSPISSLLLSILFLRSLDSPRPVDTWSWKCIKPEQQFLSSGRVGREVSVEQFDWPSLSHSFMLRPITFAKGGTAPPPISLSHTHTPSHAIGGRTKIGKRNRSGHKSRVQAGLEVLVLKWHWVVVIPWWWHLWQTLLCAVPKESHFPHTGPHNLTLWKIKIPFIYLFGLMS